MTFALYIVLTFFNTAPSQQLVLGGEVFTTLAECQLVGARMAAEMRQDLVNTAYRCEPR